MALKAEFQPKILGLFCKWCTLAGADLAGISRLKMPQTVTAVRVPCTGRIDPTFILIAFREGADAVLVGGCHPGDCHYQNGNYNAMKRILLTRITLKDFGIEPERLRIEWISAGEAKRFAQVVTEFTGEIKALGPLQWNDHKEKGDLIND